MEEIKVNPNELISGEYVRTNRGTFDRYITKHKDISNNYSWYTFENRGNITNPENYVVKHSPNIIDLIEEDDIGIMRYNGLIFKKFITKDDILELKFKNYELLDIVTKEMFNQVKYEV